LAGSTALETRGVAVGEGVVTHYGLGRFEAELGEDGERAFQHPRRGVTVPARMQLDVHEAGVVVEHAMQ
jgi:hypothetical protein